MIPKVSIIVPVYNAEPWLARAVDSIARQSLPDIEVILVNDGSTDDSPGMIRRYAENDPRIKAIHQGNRGVAAARNSGMAIATGEYIGFVDADDHVDVDFFERLYARANETGADLVKGEIRCVGLDGNVTTIGPSLGRIKENRAHLRTCFSCCIYKKDFLERNDIVFPPDILYGEDRYFLLKAALFANHVEGIDGVYYYYMRCDASLDSRELNDDKVRSMMTLAKALVGLINSISLDEQTYTLVFSSQIESLLEDIFYRTPSLELRLAIVTTVIDLFKQCRHRDACTKASPAYAGYGIGDNATGLLMYLLKHHAEIRYDTRCALFGCIPVVRRKKRGKISYGLFDKIPLLHVRYHSDKEIYRLFGFFPLWKVSHTFGKTICKLFGFIPVAHSTIEFPRDNRSL